MRGLSLVAASGGRSSFRCAGLSLSRPLLLRSTGSKRAGSVLVAHGSSCSAACGIFPDQGSNPCSLHWQADSQPLRHQGSPEQKFLILTKFGLPIMSFMDQVFGVVSKTQVSPNPRSPRFPPILSPRSFIVLHFTFRFMINLN